MAPLTLTILGIDADVVQVLMEQECAISGEVRQFFTELNVGERLRLYVEREEMYG